MPYLPSNQASESNLTNKQRALVDTLVAEDITIKDAALKAGYSSGGGGESGRATASKALRLPHVRAYFMEQVKEALAHDAAAARTLRHLNLDANSEYIRLHAANSILDRAGFTKPDHSVQIAAGEITVNIDLSE
ncbi:MAG: hypothetical protein CMM60_12440 [Rhodospirillaceae bacterium]|jgi:phage terminase small subunit|nr:hypothetical protein [Rhodospirillaceae bacterium]|tara:strand:+ start:179 stop:580 length:402 start_codon:yes stop_codon:yes gene_type:complete